MSQRVNTVEVKVREKSSTAGSLAFQAEVVPNAVYEGRELYLRLADFLNLPYDDHYRAQRMVEDITVRSRFARGAALLSDSGKIWYTYPKVRENGF